MVCSSFEKIIRFISLNFFSSISCTRRGIKLDLKLSIIQLKRRFMSVQNKMAPVFSTFLRDLTSIFSRMLENLIAG